ncbi:MAG: Uma2 family endonuclease [Chloroflexi bacterium]|nr:Uma2 family endonuclease [Chloroflexota bacterium]
MALLLTSSSETDLTYAPSRLWQISVARYHEMIEAGTLTENDRLELLEGFLVEKMTINPPHSFVTETISEMLARLFPDAFFVNTQQPVTLPDSEPEPDVSVIRGKRRDFVQHHPGPDDVVLLIEVSDATLQQDQTWKKRIYARAEIPVYWIVNLPDRQIELYSEPSGASAHPTYRHLVTYQEDDEIPVAVDGVETAVLPVRELLP